jgi:hypothetical protein
MTKFPCPDCGQKNDIDNENCEACGISFFEDGEDLSPTSLRAAARSFWAVVPAPMYPYLSSFRPGYDDELDQRQSEECAEMLPWWERESQMVVPPWIKVRLVFRALLSNKVTRFLLALAMAVASTPTGPPGSGA